MRSHTARPARHPRAVHRPGRSPRRHAAQRCTRARQSWTCSKPPSPTSRPPPCRTPASSARAIPAELDDVIEASRHAREWIANLESVERERTGIKSLKVGYNKVFGYYIEITRANDQHGPAGLHPQADPGQRRALHHPGDERVRDAGAQRRGPHPRDRDAPVPRGVRAAGAVQPGACSAPPAPWPSWTCWPRWPKPPRWAATSAPR